MKVVLSGYYGFGNAGDELILESIIAELRQKNAAVKITVLSQVPEKTAQQYNVAAIDRWNWGKIIDVIRSSDILISGGGGIFQDMTGSLSLYYYLFIILLARMLRKKIFIYAVGVNNLKPLNRSITTAIFKMTDKVTVREKDSYQLLMDWGCPADRIELVADPVLLKEVPVKKQYCVKQPQVALILRPPCRGTWPVEIFAQLADSLNHRISARVVLIPFQMTTDYEFTVAVKENMSTPAEIVCWDHCDELTRILGGSDLVISQRLHGLILAALHGIPVLGISEDPKIHRFLREIGQQNIVKLSEMTHYSLLAEVLDIWEWREDFRKNAHQLLPSFKHRAKRSSELLFKLKTE
jgi:polysaccharide pyruvyl transferase CsaB